MATVIRHETYKGTFTESIRYKLTDQEYAGYLACGDNVEAQEEFLGGFVEDGSDIRVDDWGETVATVFVEDREGEF